MLSKIFIQHFISLLAGLIPIIILYWYIHPSGIYDLLFGLDVIILFFFASKNEKLYKHRNYWLITFFLCMTYMVCAWAQKDSVNGSILTKIILSSLLAFSFIYNKLDILYMKIAHIYISIFCILNIRYLGYVPFETASINAVSIFVIILASTINFIELYNSQKISIVPSVVSVVACLYSDSRNGFITSLIYLCLILALTWHNTTRYHRYILFAFVVYSIYFITNNISLILDFNIFSRFDYRGLDLNQRDILWQGYLDQVDFSSFLFGVDYNDVPEIVSISENRNPHSSLIQAHNKFGVIGLGLLINILWLLFKMLKNRKYAIFVIVAAALSRSVTDSVFFVYLFDYFIFLIILLSDPLIYSRLILKDKPDNSHKATNSNNTTHLCVNI